jgi:WD40 repeat protein
MARAGDTGSRLLLVHAADARAVVAGFLLPALAPAAPVALDVEAAEVGALEAAVRGASAVLAVITPGLLGERGAARAELIASEAAAAGDRPVVPLLLEDCRLPPHLAMLTAVDLRDRAAWDAGLAVLRGQLAQLTGPAPTDEVIPCPYPGMRPFGAADAARFHGREREIAELVGHLAAGAPTIFVVGPSGCGKSSLIAAGAIPRLAAAAPPRRARSFRPGAAPRRALAAALEVPEAVIAAVSEPAGSAAGPLAELAATVDAAGVIVIDQLEELFTEAPRGEAARLAAALAAVARAAPGTAVVVAVRADFYAELLDSPLWPGGAPARVDLRPLRGAGLRAAIEEPARDAGVHLEPGLVDQLIADAADEPGALPLVQETLVQLWGRRRYRLLTRADYAALGAGGKSGLAVAIAARAERCLGALSPARQAIARRVLLRLVSFGEGRPHTRRQQRRSELAGAEPAAELAAVLRELAAARLVTIGGDADEADERVDMAHDVLVTAWPALAAWIAARQRDEHHRRQLQASAESWAARGRGESGLLDAGELAAAQVWRASDAAAAVGETAVVTALVSASARAVQRARWRRRWRIAAAVGAVGAITAGALLARREATSAAAAQARARQLQSDVELETARQLVVAGHPQRALPSLVAARARGGRTPTLARLFRAATRTALVRSFAHGGALVSAELASDGRLVTASTDGTVRIWAPATGAAAGPVLAHGEPVQWAALLPGGRRAVATTARGAWIWDLAGAPPTRRLLPHDDGVSLLTSSEDGSRIATASGPALRGARVWSAATGAPLTDWILHRGFIETISFSADGEQLVTSDSSGEAAWVWSATTGALARTVGGPRIRQAVFESGGRALSAVTSERTVRIWDPGTWEETLAVEASDPVRQALLLPTGILVSATEAGTVQSWGARGGEAYPALLHPRGLWHLAASADGRRLLTAGLDDAVRVWDLAEGALVTPLLEPEDNARLAVLTPDGHHVIVPGQDGIARMWRIAEPAERTPLRDPLCAVLPPEGAGFAALADGRVEVDAGPGARRAAFAVPALAAAIALARGGRAVAVITTRGEIEVWDAARGTRAAALVGSGWPRYAPLGAGSFRYARWLAVGADGAWLAGIALPDGRAARIWDAATGAPLSAPLQHAGRVLSVVASADGRRVVTASADGTVRAWAAPAGVPLGPALAPVPAGELAFAAPSPDGRMIAAVVRRPGGATVVLWDLPSGQLRGELRGHTDDIAAIAFSADSARLATASWDRTARIWDVARGALAAPPLAHLDSLDHVAFSPRGELVATVSGSRAQIWDARTGRPLTAPLEHPAQVTSAAFRGDGSALVTSSRDGLRTVDLREDERSLEEWRQIAAAHYPRLMAQAP